MEIKRRTILVILIPAIQRSLAVARMETTEFLAERLRTLGVRNRKIIVTSLAEFADVDFVVFLSDAHPDLYQAVIHERMDLCYLPSLWSSSISLLDKIDLFDSVRNRDGVNKRQLFDAILDSQDVDLSSEVVGQLSEKDLTVTLEWLVEGDWTVALRPQWISYLRRYQNKVLAWGNNRVPSKPLLVILANVIDFRSNVIPDFSKKATLGLARVAGPLIRERHEVAAFVYVTTTYVNEPVAAISLLHGMDNPGMVLRGLRAAPRPGIPHSGIFVLWELGPQMRLLESPKNYW
jgi:hypothetical protein